MTDIENLKVGDVIEFPDGDSMADATINLMCKGIQTEFMYKKDGKNGYWLVVEDICK